MCRYSVALFPEMSPETDSTFMSCIYIKTLVILSRRKTNIIQEVKGLIMLCSTGLVSMQNFRLIVPLFTGFYMVVACIIIVLSGLSVKQEVKGLTTNYSTTLDENRFT